jgi:hypothetical protein
VGRLDLLTRRRTRWGYRDDIHRPLRLDIEEEWLT